ncbi:hypothetical protein T069G_02661 [Trichoderma breve]|uniref:Uncharacterized protein n=1 Tax=Trichoderma breve TaxID=2034170 RepID=A0A9W9BFV3_9HYPO|nr:hypothetical protein T069G_02661 [Trichoderma breve]KAJ4861707.1 hypothetical protein T069G_02661 [Trichoderma breve]
MTKTKTATVKEPPQRLDIADLGIDKEDDDYADGVACVKEYWKSAHDMTEEDRQKFCTLMRTRGNWKHVASSRKQPSGHRIYKNATGKTIPGLLVIRALYKYVPAEFTQRIRESALRIPNKDRTRDYLAAYPDTVLPRPWSYDTDEAKTYQATWPALRTIPSRYRKKSTRTTGQQAPQTGQTLQTTAQPQQVAPQTAPALLTTAQPQQVAPQTAQAVQTTRQAQQVVPPSVPALHATVQPQQVAPQTAPALLTTAQPQQVAPQTAQAVQTTRQAQPAVPQTVIQEQPALQAARNALIMPGVALPLSPQSDIHDNTTTAPARDIFADLLGMGRLQSDSPTESLPSPPSRPPPSPFAPPELAQTTLPSGFTTANTQGQRRTYEEAFGNDIRENDAGRGRNAFTQPYANATTPLSNTAATMATPYAPAANQLPLSAAPVSTPEMLRDGMVFRPLSVLHQQQPPTPLDGTYNALVQRDAEQRAWLSALTTDVQQLAWILSRRTQ